MYSVPIVTIGMPGDGPDDMLPEGDIMLIDVRLSDQEQVLSQYLPLPRPTEELTTIVGYFLTTIKAKLDPIMPGLTAKHLARAVVVLRDDARGGSFGYGGESCDVHKLSDWMMQYARMGLKKMIFYIEGYTQPEFANSEQKTVEELNDELFDVASKRHIEFGGAKVHIEMVTRLLAACAEVTARDAQERTPLHAAALGGHTEIVQLLLIAGAQSYMRDNRGSTAADVALAAGHPTCVRLLDPALAEREGAKLRREFETAHVVHVLSTRFELPLGSLDSAYPRKLCDPREAAQTVKRVLEERGSHGVQVTKVFNPNQDNALLETGDPTAANAIWLLNWRQIGLHRAKETNGYCIQIVVHGGLSKMQEAEEDMAKSEGVPVIRIQCQDLEGLDYGDDLVARARLDQLCNVVGVEHSKLLEDGPPREVKRWARIEINERSVRSVVPPAWQLVAPSVCAVPKSVVKGDRAKIVLPGDARTGESCIVERLDGPGAMLRFADGACEGYRYTSFAVVPE